MLKNKGSFALYKGVIIASLSSFGHTPCSNDKLTIFVRGHDGILGRSLGVADGTGGSLGKDDDTDGCVVRTADTGGSVGVGDDIGRYGG